MQIIGRFHIPIKNILQPTLRNNISHIHKYPQNKKPLYREGLYYKLNFQDYPTDGLLGLDPVGRDVGGNGLGAFVVV